MDSNQNQLARLDNQTILDVVTKMQTLSDTEKKEIQLRILSDDLDIRKSAIEKIRQSERAYEDFVNIMGEVSALNKTGMYIKTKQTIKTGSGTFEIESKGGDTRLIIPVLVIVAIVIIALLIIMFWHK
jgi:hypothetical protein